MFSLDFCKILINSFVDNYRITVQIHNNSLTRQLTLQYTRVTITGNPDKNNQFY